jgi:predicted lipoprotein with Yx(FWY)xxD motif
MTEFPPRRGAWLRLPALVILALVAAGCRPASAPGTDASPTASPTEGTADALVVVADSPELGSFLTDAEGKTLYLFTNDSEGQSTCTGDCAVTYPPLTVEGEAEAVAGDGVSGELGTITRDDGSLQVTIAGHPLYYYAADQEPGDTTGHGVGGIWFAVSPDGSKIGSDSGDDDGYY